MIFNIRMESKWRLFRFYSYMNENMKMKTAWDSFDVNYNRVCYSKKIVSKTEKKNPRRMHN